jgi:hypothetical protein
MNESLKNLEGLWVLTRQQDGEFEYEAHIESCVVVGHSYLARLHSWITGEPTCLKLLSMKQLFQGEMFETREQLREYYETFAANRR